MLQVQHLGPGWVGAQVPVTQYQALSALAQVVLGRTVSVAMDQDRRGSGIEPPPCGAGVHVGVALHRARTWIGRCFYGGLFQCECGRRCWCVWGQVLLSPAGLTQLACHGLPFVQRAGQEIVLPVGCTHRLPELLVAFVVQTPGVAVAQ